MLRRSDTEQNHLEHQFLIQESRVLEEALAGLVCHSEVYANMVTAEQVARCGHYLGRNLPTHFANEEQLVLERVAALGPEWREFALEMRRQHLKLQGKLDVFLSALDELSQAQDLEQAIAEVKRCGLELTRDLKFHMITEERLLNTISTHS